MINIKYLLLGVIILLLVVLFIFKVPIIEKGENTIFKNNTTTKTTTNNNIPDNNETIDQNNFDEVKTIEEKKIIQEILEDINENNYCEEDKDCAISCFNTPHEFACGYPYLYNVQTSQKNLESLIEKLNEEERKINANTSCFYSFCDDSYLETLSYSCQNKKCVFN